MLLRIVAAAGLALLSSCGYHVAGRAELMPQNVRTIAIPHWGNATARHRLSEKIPASLSREFIARTKYRIVPDPNEADAILSGSVLRIDPIPTTLDPVSQRTSGLQVIAVLEAKLTERATGKVLFERAQFEVRNRYEIGIDQRAYFEESNAALDRMSVEVARQLVSAILENF